MTYAQSIKNGSIETWDSVMPALCSVEMTNYICEIEDPEVLFFIPNQAYSIAEKDTVEIINQMIDSAGDV